MSTTTVRLGLTRPVTADGVTGLRTAIGSNADALDNSAPITIGTSFPGSPVAGQFFLHGTQKVLYVWSGTEWIEIVSNGGASPIGSVLDYGGTADPTDISGAQRWLLCDGRPLSQATYPELYAVLGSTWNTFDGQAAPAAGNFRLPRLGRRITMASNDVSGAGSVPSGLTSRARGQAGGEETHILLPAETSLRAHSHGVTDPTHGHSIYDPGHAHQSIVKTVAGNVAGQAGGPAVPRWEWEGWTGTTGSGTGIGIYGAATGISIQNNATANGSAHENMPPFAVIGPRIIRVK